MPKRPTSNRKPLRRKQEEPQPDGGQPRTLRATLAQNLTDNARLRLELERQREATEALAKQLNRLDMDLSRAARTVLEAADALARLHGAEAGDVDAYRDSVRRTIGALARGLEQHSGIEIIGAVGEIADPATHKILESRDHPEFPVGTVLGVAAHGLKYHGEVIQTSTVIVSSGPTSPSGTVEGATE
ncbi:nucleotide exchange factor GrpE [Glycomyces rhizosphaerae]|uniref:Nucleotide exchange factor GrpE n=1 Tax=Glycomyces rhizosphaerae TaxID=2054422 RepID=A0ABV7PTV1_9ACTN